MSKRRKIAIVLASLMFSFFLLDFLLARTVPINCQVSTPNEVLHHVLIPLSHCRSTTKEFKVDYSINDLGLRNERLDVAKPENTKRFLFVGDSFTYGTGVNLSDSFPKQFENVINSEKKDKIVQVINAGVPGYGLILEDLYLRFKGINLKPDVVVVNLSMTDFFDERRYLKIANKDESGMVIAVPGYASTPYFPPAIHKFLKNNSFLYNVFLKKQEDLWKLKGKFLALASRQKQPDYSNSEPSVTVGDLDNDTFAITRQVDDESFVQLFGPVASRIKEMKSYMDLNNIKMVLVIIPNGHQIDKNQWTLGRKPMKLEDDIYPTKIFEEIIKLSDDNKIPVINVVDDLKEYNSSNPKDKLFFDYDGHLTPTGNKVIAKKLLKEFTENLLNQSN